MDILEQLMRAYADGYGKLILPLDKPSWQASMDGAAGEFIKRETKSCGDSPLSECSFALSRSLSRVAR